MFTNNCHTDDPEIPVIAAMGTQEEQFIRFASTNCTGHTALGNHNRVYIIIRAHIILSQLIHLSLPYCTDSIVDACSVHSAYYSGNECQRMRLSLISVFGLTWGQEAGTRRASRHLLLQRRMGL